MDAAVPKAATSIVVDNVSLSKLDVGNKDVKMLEPWDSRVGGGVVG